MYGDDPSYSELSSTSATSNNNNNNNKSNNQTRSKSPKSGILPDNV